MAANSVPVLKKISDSGQTVAAGDEDVRGRQVTDADGNDLGEVDDLLIDEVEHRVRFLLVEHGGFLGIGEKKSFVPVDAVTRVTDDRVHVGQSRDRVAEAPPYDPDVVDEETYYDRVYAHYGYPPFWGTGYVYPGYPYYG